MKQLFRRIALALVVLALCLPLGLMVVYLLFPLWSWIEATFAVEAVGHAGPAPWCYLVVYIGLVTAAAGAIYFASRTRSRS